MRVQPAGVFSTLVHPSTIPNHSPLRRTAVLVLGCTVGPDYVPPKIDARDQWSTSAAVSNDAPDSANGRAYSPTSRWKIILIKPTN